MVENKSSQQVYLIDGTSLCYRSFYAIRLTNSKGAPCGAIYGFLKTLQKILTKDNPRYVAVCFDVSRKTFRQEKYQDYKIHRPPTPPDLNLQFPVIKKLVKLWGVNLLEKQGFEADDLIADCTQKAKADKKEVVIVASDKDMLQLLDGDSVKIYNYQKDIDITEKNFVKANGHDPKCIIDYLALVGDSSDNIPGAKGIGKVGAKKLINKYKTVENVFDHLSELPPKIKSLLEANRDNIFLSKELVILQPPDWDVSIEDLVKKEPNYEEIYKLYLEYEFKSLLKELPSFKAATVKVEKGIPQDKKEYLEAQEIILSVDRENLYLWSEKNNCVYQGNVDNIKDLLTSVSIRKVFYDYKAQLKTALLENIEIKGPIFDLKVAAYLLDVASLDYELSGLSLKYLGEICEDADLPVTISFISRLYKKMYMQIKEKNLIELCNQVEMPLISVLDQMEKTGVNIDLDTLEQLLVDVEKILQKTKVSVFSIAGHEFNLNSSQQLQKVLFQELKIPTKKRTKTGYSTREDVLQFLAKKNPIAEYLLEYRKLNKLETTYIKPLIEQVKNEKGKLHTTFNQTVTQTGRLSSSAPNLQSIPAKGEFSSALRKAFIPSEKNGYILSADYSQIELRILAHFSKDTQLKQAFIHQRDIHAFTAALLFNVKEQSVTKKQRNFAKRINFGIVYGMSAFGLVKELDVSFQEAEKFIDDYFLRYPGVKKYIEKIYQELENRGYVETLFGRRRYFPEYKSDNPQIKEFACRQAVNTPIQGTCADIIKLAMIEINQQFKEQKLSSKLIIQIHDELVFDVVCKELPKLIEIVRLSMQNVVKLDVPIEVNLKSGKNWGEMQEIKKGEK